MAKRCPYCGHLFDDNLRLQGHVRDDHFRGEHSRVV
jgi:uncharacterized C2H2 Zn-finger protein